MIPSPQNVIVRPHRQMLTRLDLYKSLNVDQRSVLRFEHFLEAGRVRHHFLFGAHPLQC